MSKEYVVYKPVYQDRERLVISNEEMSSEFKENLKFVLEFYDISYQESEGKILIPEDVWKDRDTVWNYTTKAKSSDWLAANKESTD